jgi:DNA-binding transcriptional LysR family regulator
MELRHFRYFVAVAEELNFHRAAERLHISQPSLSQQIMALEHEIGTPLLERDSKGVQLTRTGRVFLEEARRTLRQADRAREAGRGGARGWMGVLRVGYSPFGSSSLIPPILRAYEERHPEIEVSVSTPWLEALVDRLLEGELDVGFFRLPSEMPDELEHRVIGRDALVGAVPASHPYAERELLSLSDLKGQRFVATKRELNPLMYDHFMTHLFPSEGVDFSAERQEPSLESVLAAVADGWGLTVMVTDLVDLYRPDGVVYIPFAEPAPYIETAVAWRRSDPPESVLTFVTVCEEVTALESGSGTGQMDTPVP